MEKTNLRRENSLSAPSSNVVGQPVAVSRAQREARNGHRGAVVWLTGLPGSGKSTIARATEQTLYDHGLQTATLDGDNIRLGLCTDLGFSEKDRNENVRRVAETAKMFLDQGIVVIVALVSPVRHARELIKQMVPNGDFLEIYCRCPLSVCQTRDPKGHYARAKRGEIANFTGISSIYEEPLKPALLLNTDTQTSDESVRQLTALVLEKCEITATLR
ncbi:adenylyl-sulfate kinase [Caballeronia sp. LjRoot29]|uniref:adenylyl-sulfate kinase n=1 Tax=Caballeronia sp. LjRoot29 TaxID=3342315 RepID=UPI003ED061DB